MIGMEFVFCRWTPDMSLASISQHAMFAVVPLGMALLIVTRFQANPRLRVLLPQRSHWTLDAFPYLAGSMLSAQSIVIAMQYCAAPDVDDAHFASVLSLIATVASCARVKSDLSSPFRQKAYPVHFVAVTLCFDVAASQTSFATAFWAMSVLNLLMVSSKTFFILVTFVLYWKHLDARQPNEPDRLGLVWQAWRYYFLPISNDGHDFTAADLPNPACTSALESIFPRFCNHWDQGKQIYRLKLSNANNFKAERSSRPTMLKILALTFRRECLLLFTFRLVYVSLYLCRPLLLWRVMKLVEKSDATTGSTWIIIATAILLHVGIAVCTMECK